MNELFSPEIVFDNREDEFLWGFCCLFLFQCCVHCIVYGLLRCGIVKWSSRRRDQDKKTEKDIKRMFTGSLNATALSGMSVSVQILLVLYHHGGFECVLNFLMKDVI